VALSLARVWTRHADESYRACWKSVQNDANEVGMGFKYLSNLSKPCRNSGERGASAPFLISVAVLFTACTASDDVFFRLFLSLISPNGWREKQSWRRTGVEARHNSTADVTSGWYIFMHGMFWHHARSPSAVAVASASLSTFDMCAAREKGVWVSWMVCNPQAQAVESCGALARARLFKLY
jgi:hypothetical protein